MKSKLGAEFLLVLYFKPRQINGEVVRFDLKGNAVYLEAVHEIITKLI